MRASSLRREHFLLQDRGAGHRKDGPVAGFPEDRRRTGWLRPSKPADLVTPTEWRVRVMTPTGAGERRAGRIRRRRPGVSALATGDNPPGRKGRGRRFRQVLLASTRQGATPGAGERRAGSVRGRWPGASEAAARVRPAPAIATWTARTSAHDGLGLRIAVRGARRRRSGSRARTPRPHHPAQRRSRRRGMTPEPYRSRGPVHAGTGSRRSPLTDAARAHARRPPRDGPGCPGADAERHVRHGRARRPADRTRHPASTHRALGGPPSHRRPGMPLTTTDRLQDLRNLRCHDIVIGEAIVGANVARGCFASMRGIVGGRSAACERRCTGPAGWPSPTRERSPPASGQTPWPAPTATTR